MATRGIAPVLVQVARLVVIWALTTILRWLLRLLRILSRRSGSLAFLVGRYAFADGVHCVGDAAVLDARLEETHYVLC